MLTHKHILTIPHSKIKDFCQLPLHKGAFVPLHRCIIKLPAQFLRRSVQALIIICCFSPVRTSPFGRKPFLACQKSTDISKTVEYSVGAIFDRPAILKQNCIAKGDCFLFSSETATIASQLLRGRRNAAPTVSNEADGFLTA